MRKLFCLILAVMMLCVIAGTVSAEVVFSRGPDSRVLTSASANTASATQHTSITVGINRVLGFTYSDSAASSVGVYDDTTTSTTASRLIGELYVAAGSAYTVMFPLPREVAYGIVTKMADATGFVIIYYE